MTNLKDNQRDLIEGRAALSVIDIQASTFIDDSAVRSIDNMPGYRDRMLLARKAVDAAWVADTPVIFIQEIHRADLVDSGANWTGMRISTASTAIPKPNWLLPRWDQARRLPHTETSLFLLLLRRP